jgi:O-antigen ligase
MDWLKDKKTRTDRLLFYSCLGAFFTIPLGNAPMTFFGVCAALIWIMSGTGFRLKNLYFKNSWCWPVLLLIILHWVGLLYTVDTHGQAFRFAKKTHYWLYGLAVAAIAFERFSAEGLVKAFLAGLTVNALTAVVHVFVLLSTNKTSGDLGIGPGYSNMAAFLVVGIILSSFYLGKHEDRRTRSMFALLMGLFFFHLVMMKGRNGYFTLLMLLPIIVNNCFKRINILKIILVYGIIIGLMLMSPSVRQGIHDTVLQIQAFTHVSEEQSWGKDYIVDEPGKKVDDERLWILANALAVIKDNPVFGVGTGGFQTAVKKRSKPHWPLLAHPHNNFLYMAVSFGGVGVVILAWLFWEMVRNSWPYRDTAPGHFVLASALVIFVSGIFNAQIINASTAFFLAVSVGLQQSLPKFLLHEVQLLTTKPPPCRFQISLQDLSVK